MDAYVFGLGEKRRCVARCLLEEVFICGYIDNYKADSMGLFDGKPIVRQGGIREPYDYIIITLLEYEDVRNSLVEQGVRREKIVSFFDAKDASNEQYWGVLDAYKWRVELMWIYHTEVAVPTIDNLNYELYADSEHVRKGLPKIMDAEDTVRILARGKKSLARFGDGEFELMFGRSRPKFQSTDCRLAERLREALHSHEENLLIAIADNYGSLAKYTDEAARGIRMYMTKEVREDHMKALDLDRQYYDAYLSRAYIMYRDKTDAKGRFDRIREIWGGQNVLVIEGRHTRFGVGNDLLENAESVERILVPDKNAFEKYGQIIEAARRYGKGKLILSILGPTATVLAYDLAREDYWIIDIGQLDTEYEWFLRGVERRCSLKYKNVSEIAYHEVIGDDGKFGSYYNEIVEEI